mmetsp:Transcript_12305/g.37920  ORF Transcript_12305/g.37920 Transcript_12305/m.37920 type:complete len:142 (-) Transcript_12305:47-472(-)
MMSVPSLNRIASGRASRILTSCRMNDVDLRPLPPAFCCGPPSVPSESSESRSSRVMVSCGARLLVDRRGDVLCRFRRRLGPGAAADASTHCLGVLVEHDGRGYVQARRDYGLRRRAKILLAAKTSGDLHKTCCVRPELVSK